MNWNGMHQLAGRLRKLGNRLLSGIQMQHLSAFIALLMILAFVLHEHQSNTNYADDLLR